jgi:hypothetical protein
MESLIYNLFFHQWQRKLMALVTALIIWVFVNYSITSSKTIPSVPIRVINLPPDKTIPGLLPNGFLSKRISLTLSGTRDIIDQVEPGDVEVILDISHLPSDGIAQITKKNLISLNPNINLSKHVTSVSHPEFVIKLDPILTEKIPITITEPIGQAPPGYDFLDIWPVQLYQTVSGPREDVLALKNQGLELTFDLNKISREQLDGLTGNGPYDDEISFYIPDAWKQVPILFSTKGYEAMNDPESKNLQINFLRKQLLPIKTNLSLHVFYPLKNSDAINPKTYPLAESEFIHFQNDIPVLELPLYAANVSKLFLEVVKDSIEIDIVAAPQTEREKLEWGVSFIDDAHLEDTYTAFLLSNSKSSEPLPGSAGQKELHYRNRFQLFVQQFALYLTSDYPLELEARLENNQVVVHIPNTFVLQKKE